MLVIKSRLNIVQKLKGLRDSDQLVLSNKLALSNIVDHCDLLVESSRFESLIVCHIIAYLRHHLHILAKVPKQRVLLQETTFSKELNKLTKLKQDKVHVGHFETDQELLAVQLQVFYN